jgi:predicted AAA+ superfamily ATPase
MKNIRPFINRNIVKVLTGIRRCGKSAMLELIKEELYSLGVDERNVLSVNFETRAFDFVDSADETYRYIRRFAAERGAEKRGGKIYLFFDEIQELPGWETMINACMIDFDADIYLTGSNAKMLSGELATYLGGRYVEFRIYPFSYGEILDSPQGTGDRDIFQTYLTRGGMPFLYQFPLDDRAAKQYLTDIYDSIILKDIISRYNVRDTELLKRTIAFFIANTGNTFSAATMMRYLKSEQRSLSTETVYNYIDYCKNACLIHLVPREDIIGKRLLQFREKLYLSDHGIREAIYGNNLRDINQILENIVYLELLRRGYTVFVGKNGEKEIDFVAVDGAERIYIQVCYLLADDQVMDREFGALETIPDNYPKYVVTMDEIERSRDGIRNVNIRDFLLKRELISKPE